MENYYDVLQISRNAEPEVVAAAYRALAMKYHPDRNPSDEANKVMVRLNQAYAVLGNAVRREEYDRVYGFQSKKEDAGPYAEDNKQSEGRRQSEAAQRSWTSQNFAEEMARSHRKYEDFSGICGLYFYREDDWIEFFRFFSDGLVLVKVQRVDKNSPLPEVRIDRMKGDSFNFSGSYWHVDGMVEFDTYSDDGPVSYSGHVCGSEIELDTVSLRKNRRKKIRLQRAI